MYVEDLEELHPGDVYWEVAYVSQAGEEADPVKIRNFETMPRKTIVHMIRP